MSRSMTRKNLILYLHHLVLMVGQSKITAQTGMSQILMLPGRLNNAGLLRQIHFNETADAGIWERQLFLNNKIQKVNKIRDTLIATKHKFHLKHVETIRIHIHDKTYDSKDVDILTNEIHNAKENLDPFVSVDGHKIAPEDFTDFVWDLCLDINNPDESDLKFHLDNPNVYTNGSTHPEASIYNDELTESMGSSSDSDKRWLAKLSKARQNQDRCWGRINNLKNRI